MSKKLIEAIAEINEPEALAIAKKLLDSGADPFKVLDDAREALKIVGQRFEERKYFLPELMMSAEIVREISELAKPLLTKDVEPKHRGKIVFGTVEGDIHDIGKDIVTLMLNIHGFEVYDLGVDVHPAQFVAKLKETKAPILGLSGFLHVASQSMKRTIEALVEAGLRDKVKVMIGGGQIDESLKQYTGADGWGNDATMAVTLAEEWIAK